MSQPEGTVDLMKQISKGYETAIAGCARLLKNNADAGGERGVIDLLSILKKTLKRMKRSNPEWTSLHHGEFYFDDDEMGNVRVILITDVLKMIKGFEHPKPIFTVENIHVDPVLDTALKGDASDHFLDKVELYGPDICRDMFIAMNYMGHAEAGGYKAVSCELVDPDGQNARIEMVMHRKNVSAIKLTVDLVAIFNNLKLIDGWRISKSC